jgi:ATP-dependent Zn protease
LEGKQVARVKARQLTAMKWDAFVGSLIDENNGIEKTNIGTPWKHTRDNMDNAIFKYNSRRVFNQVLTAIAGRAAEEIVVVLRMTVGAQQDIAQMTRVVRTMVLRKITKLKQQAQQKSILLRK